MDKINLEVTLCKLLYGLWPPSIDKMVYCNDKEYPLLVAEASRISLKSRCVSDHFYVKMSYALVGFEAREGGWKAVFTPYIQVCNMTRGLDNLNLNSYVSGGIVAALIPLLGMETEICLDMPRMEKLPLTSINREGFVVERDETYWRIADKERGGC